MGEATTTMSSFFSPNGLLAEKAASLTKGLDQHRWSLVEDRTSELLAHIQPNSTSEQRRDALVSHLQRLILSSVPHSQVFPVGSVPLKTYLPDGDVDLVVFSENQSLTNEVRDMLESQRKGKNESEDGSEFRVLEVHYIEAEVKIVKCLVENTVVDISFNQLGGLCSLCFLEEVDKMIGQNHLFKRSIILIKAWCFYESRILGAQHGLMSTYALETLVIYIFRVYNMTFAGPLEVLLRFLDFFSKFDWNNYCISLWGPVPVQSLPSMRAAPPRQDTQELLLNEVFLNACVYCYGVRQSSKEDQERPFVPKFLNIVDPLRENNNLGRSISKGSLFRIRSAISFGAERLLRLLDCPEEKLIAEFDFFFKNTWDRHGKGHWVPYYELYPKKDNAENPTHDQQPQQDSQPEELNIGNYDDFPPLSKTVGSSKTNGILGTRPAKNYEPIGGGQSSKNGGKNQQSDERSEGSAFGSRDASNRYQSEVGSFNKPLPVAPPFNRPPPLINAPISPASISSVGMTPKGKEITEPYDHDSNRVFLIDQGMKLLGMGGDGKEENENSAMHNSYVNMPPPGYYGFGGTPMLPPPFPFPFPINMALPPPFYYPPPPPPPEKDDILDGDFGSYFMNMQHGKHCLKAETQKPQITAPPFVPQLNMQLTGQQLHHHPWWNNVHPPSPNYMNHHYPMMPYPPFPLPFPPPPLLRAPVGAPFVGPVVPRPYYPGFNQFGPPHPQLLLPWRAAGTGTYLPDPESYRIRFNDVAQGRKRNYHSKNPRYNYEYDRDWNDNGSSNGSGSGTGSSGSGRNQNSYNSRNGRSENQNNRNLKRMTNNNNNSNGRHNGQQRNASKGGSSGNSRRK